MIKLWRQLLRSDSERWCGTSSEPIWTWRPWRSRPAGAPGHAERPKLDADPTARPPGRSTAHSISPAGTRGHASTRAQDNRGNPTGRWGWRERAAPGSAGRTKLISSLPSSGRRWWIPPSPPWKFAIYSGDIPSGTLQFTWLGRVPTLYLTQVSVSFTGFLFHVNLSLLIQSIAYDPNEPITVFTVYLLLE